MPVRSYVIVTRAGESARVEARLARLPGCVVRRALERDVLLLVPEPP